MTKLHRTSLFFLLLFFVLATIITACTPSEDNTSYEIQQEQTVEENNSAQTTDEVENEQNEITVQAPLNTNTAAEREILYLVALGDSLTEGIGDETEKGGYVGLLEEKLKENNFAVITENFGKKGQRTNQLLKQLSKQKVKEAIQKAQIITITIGANDLMHALKESILQKDIGKFNTFQETYANNLTAIIKELGEINSHAPIYFIGIYNPLQQLYPQLNEIDFILNKWNNVTKNSIKTLNSAVFVPIDDLFNDGATEYLAEDRFHPNYNGYKKIAEKLFPYIEDQLNNNSSS